MFLKNILPRLIVNEHFANNLANNSEIINNENVNNQNQNQNNLVSNIANNTLNENIVTSLANNAINQKKLDMVTVMVWVISLVLLLTLGVWLWNRVLVELFPAVNKITNPFQILGLIVLLNMIF